MVTLEQVRANAAPKVFPRRVLKGCETGLVLFSAAFYGAQDAVWLALANIQATCVDKDHGKLGEMVLGYPEGWEYVHGDAYEYARVTERRWDVVTVDCPSDHFARCAGMLPEWCALANRAVVLGYGVDTVVEAPAGWEVTERLRRSDFLGGVWWAVVEPC